MIKILSILIVILFTVQINANSADSLKALLGDIHDTNNYRIYNELFFLYLKSNLDSALKYTQMGLEQAELNNNPLYISIYNDRLGRMCFFMGLNHKAIPYFKQAYKNNLRRGDTTDALRNLNNLGVVLIHLGKYKEAGKILFDAIEWAEKINASRRLCSLNSNIGRLYYDQGDTLKAIKYYNKALNIAHTINYKKIISDTYNRLGILYKENNIYDSALYYFDKSLEINKNIGNNIGELDNIRNIGDVYLEMGKLEDALKYYKKQLNLNINYNSDTKKASNLDAFGNFYLKTGDIDQAINNYNKALLIYRKLGKSKELRDSYKKISETHKLNHNYDSALFYYELYTNMKDSIFTIEKSKQIAELESIYETEKKEKEILRLEKEQEQKQNQMLLLGGLSALLFILVVFSFIYYKSQQKSLVLKAVATEQKKHFKAVINAQEEERKRIAGELHDSVGPLLSVTTLYLSDLADTIKKTESEQAEVLQKSLKILDEASTETRNISHNLMPGVLIRSGLVPACKELIRKIKETKAFEIQFHTKGYNKRLEETVEITFYRVLQELLNNIIKHAQASQVKVKLSRQNGTLELLVKDNGKGFKTTEKGKSSGIGLQNIHSRLSLINGNITIDSTDNKGTTVCVTAPVNG